MYAHSFRFYFTLLFEVLFTFPSRYSFAIDLSVVFSLGGWCRRFQTGFLRSRPTQGSAAVGMLACTGLSPSSDALPNAFHFACFPVVAALQPLACRNTPGLGSSPFARHYLGNHSYFLFLRILRCFSSPGLPPDDRVTCVATCWVAPFGHLRIKGYLHLPGAFRSLSRPSSPLRARASPVRS